MDNIIDKVYNKILDNIVGNLLKKIFFLIILSMCCSTIIDNVRNFIFQVVLIAFIFSFGCFVIMIFLVKIKRLGILKNMLYSDKDYFLKELNQAIFLNYNEYILTDSFILDARLVKLMRYNDMYCMYSYLESFLFSKTVSKSLKIFSFNDVIILRLSSNSIFKKYYTDLVNLIKEKNPNVILCKRKDVKKIIIKSKKI